ncbi:hypothetical protein EMIT0210MI2_14184 [Priestia megaterium]
MKLLLKLFVYTDTCSYYLWKEGSVFGENLIFFRVLSYLSHWVIPHY